MDTPVVRFPAGSQGGLASAPVPLTWGAAEERLRSFAQREGTSTDKAHAATVILSHVSASKAAASK